MFSKFIALFSSVVSVSSKLLKEAQTIKNVNKPSRKILSPIYGFILIVRSSRFLFRSVYVSLEKYFLIQRKMGSPCHFTGIYNCGFKNRGTVCGANPIHPGSPSC